MNAESLRAEARVYRADKMATEARLCELAADTVDVLTARAEEAERERDDALRALQMIAGELEGTRWKPDGLLSDWGNTPEGRNYARVFAALKVAREVTAKHAQTESEVPGATRDESDR